MSTQKRVIELKIGNVIPAGTVTVDAHYMGLTRNVCFYVRKSDGREHKQVYKDPNELIDTFGQNIGVK